MESGLASAGMPSKAVQPATAVAATAVMPTRVEMPATAGMIATGTPLSVEMPAKKDRHQLSATVGKQSTARIQATARLHERQQQQNPGNRRVRSMQFTV